MPRDGSYFRRGPLGPGAADNKRNKVCGRQDYLQVPSICKGIGDDGEVFGCAKDHNPKTCSLLEGSNLARQKA